MSGSGEAFCRVLELYPQGEVDDQIFRTPREFRDWLLHDQYSPIGRSDYYLEPDDPQKAENERVVNQVPDDQLISWFLRTQKEYSTDDRRYLILTGQLDFELHQ